MKKKIALLLAAMMLLSLLSACGGSNDAIQTETPASTEQSEETSASTEAIGKLDLEETHATESVPEETVNTDDSQTQAPVKAEQKPVNAGNDYPKAYLEKAKALAAENENYKFSLVKIDDDEIPELVADNRGFHLSVYTYNRTIGELVTLIDQWPYGAAGNTGYEYEPNRNLIRNVSTGQMGTVTYYAYYMIDGSEVLPYFGKDICERHFVDSNGNGLLDPGEEYSAEPTAYFVGGEQVSAEEFASYRISGEYQYLMGEKTAAELEKALS